MRKNSSKAQAAYPQVTIRHIPLLLVSLTVALPCFAQANPSGSDKTLVGEKAGSALALPMVSNKQAAQADTAQNGSGATPNYPVGGLPDRQSDSQAAAATDAAKFIFKPGQPITVNTAAEDIQPTDNVELARRQAQAYPDNPEACFILAVALTRTSQVEEALKEVRHAKSLAQAKGGADYFDKMISSYEKMLEYCPEDNRIRYDLAWAYYMKAYLVSQAARKAAANNPVAQAAAAVDPNPTVKAKNINANLASSVLGMLSPQLGQNLPGEGKVSSQALPHIKGALELAPPAAAGQVKTYYEAALKNLDDILHRTPDDVWSRVYRAHLNAEYTGDLESAMTVWRQCEKKYPQNPASYFFLGEGYLKQGNLKESLNNISRAIALRALGN